MSRPWMPLYVADFLADTLDLRADEIGVYMTLLMLAWRRNDGALPADQKWLKRSLESCFADFHGHTFNRIVPKILARFFVLEDGKYTNKRLTKERQTADKFSAKQKENADKRWSKDNNNKHLDDATAMPVGALQSQSHTQRKKEETASAVPSKYAFEDGIIRLNKKDFDSWKLAFSNLDLAAELLSLSKWAESEGKNWFHAVKGALAKRNREIKTKKDALADQGGFKWNGNIEGVI